jgi:glutamyl-tRNA synthetase
MPVRVRFAPSPTGPLHIGGVRTALYNFLFAKKHGGTFILRIEDTDRQRYVGGAEAYILQALAWMGISPAEGPEHGGDYGPYRQSERKKLYIKNIERLVAQGNVYLAFDTAAELSALRKAADSNGETFIYNWKNRSGLKNSLSMTHEEVQSALENDTPFVYRFIAHRDGENKDLFLEDIVRGRMRVDKSLLDDKVLVKQDGMPTYHLANVVDDHLMEISHVVRGEEWLPSLAMHLLLYQAFGWQAPEFAHVPLILKPKGKGKLSKRDGATFGFPVFPLEWKGENAGFRESGYLPEALLNYLALLGWNDGSDRELFSLDELTSAFSLTSITKSGGRFDPDRCKWFNQQYLAQLSVDELIPVLQKELAVHGVEQTSMELGKVVSLIQDRLVLLSDLWKEAAVFFVRPSDFDEKAVQKQWKAETPKILLALEGLITSLDDKSAEGIRTAVKKWADANEIRLGAVMAPLRLALVGEMKGPDVFMLCQLIGGDETSVRILFAVETISA